MNDLARYTQQNRKAWDEIAEVRHARFPPAAFFAQGGTRLAPHVIEAAGDVQGRRLLHLQCATGEDALSWSVLGAEATGVDISPRQIEFARQKAAEAGLSTQFIAADIYDLPASLRQADFDFVFTGGGALVWLPDIDRWGQIVAEALKPGGRLILDEEHPIANILSIRDGCIVIEEDYFGRKPERYPPGWSHFDAGKVVQEEKYEVSWPLGDIVTALIRAGLVIEALQEYPSQAAWRFGDKLDEAQRLPGDFLLLAQKK